ncbi:MAG: bacteriohemerythrin [Gammaproteobacteria bacterium]|nr:bacteriohemerythrin [Gammaproteobacteria bacterium]MBU1414056.1 bacteriohemerythrin [Gammaproteobacteria bacterium]
MSQVDINFTPIEWSEKMATGVPQVDAQHRYLVDTLRRANDRLLGDHEGALLGEIAKDLLNYAIMHFETEESLMKRYGYEAAFPDVARAHIAQHRDFSRQVVAVCDHLREGRPVSRMDVLKYLNEWLRNHVLGIDQKLGAFVREAEARQAAEPPA